MIVWSGRGFLSVLVLIATLIISISIFPDEMADYSFIISFFAAGLFSGVLGKKWNSTNERIVIDEKSGERLRLKNNHTLFWIPMQYWGIIFSIIAIVILFQNSLIFGVITTMLLLMIIAVPFIIKKNNPKIEKDKTAEKSSSTVLNKKSNTNETISELKQEKLVDKEFEKSDHSKFMPK